MTSIDPELSLIRHFFQHTPHVNALASVAKGELFPTFLHWAREQRLSLDWTMPMHLLRWMQQQDQWSLQIDTAIIKELLITTVTRWSLYGLDHIPARGIMVMTTLAPDLVVGLWKSVDPEKASKIVSIQLPDARRPRQDSYAIAYQHDCWEAAEWLAL